jgi:SAM-dependent methyltransferase
VLLVCPACRRHSERGLELSSLEPDGAEWLRCQGCARRYPLVEGIALVLRDLPQSDGWRGELSPADSLALSVDLDDPDALAARAAAGRDGEPAPFLAEQLSSYLPSWEAGAEALAEQVRARPRVESALELGCGVGRTLFELSHTAGAAVGLDRNPAFLRAARRLLDGRELSYARRMAGRWYERATVRAPAAAANVELVCGDVLDPPFAPAQFDRVVALNLLDAVRSPRALLHHLHQLCAPGGEILLASPYAWRDDVVPPEERLGTVDPPAALRDEIRALGWTIEDEADLPWTLRRDARAASVYRTDFVRARR